VRPPQTRSPRCCATCPASVTQAGSGRRSAPASVRRWANEVAARGSFVGRCGEVQAAANPGALPVPTLVVANKADLRGTRPLCCPPSPWPWLSSALFLSAQGCRSPRFAVQV